MVPVVVLLDTLILELEAQLPHHLTVFHQQLKDMLVVMLLPLMVLQVVVVLVVLEHPLQT